MADFVELSKESVLLGLAVFLLTLIFSILLYNGYDFFGQYLSELGIGITAIVFNSGVIISGFLFLPLAFVIFKKNKILFKFSSGAIVISLVSFICVGVFPINHSLHFYAAAIFFIFAALGILFSAIGCLFSKNKKDAYVSFAVFLIIFLFLITSQSVIMQKVSVLFILIWAFLQVWKN